MDSNKQPIQGSILTTFINFLFGGIDKILDSAAEYEEEMGVLKQVSRIPLTDKDGKQYELVIKLSPVRNKNGYFYVEASCDKPGFDVSLMNKVVVQLNNQTMKEFNSKVNEMIEKNKLAVAEVDESDKETSDDDAGPQLSEDQANRIVNEARRKFKPIKVRLVKAEQDAGYTNQIEGELVTDIELADDYQNCVVTLSVDQISNDSNINIQSESATTQLSDPDSLINKIKDFQTNYMEANGIEKWSANSSKVVDATLKKVTGSTELTLMAINASCNIKAALDMLSDVVDDNEFIDSFADEEEKSIEITDLGDNYDVEEIDQVDITPTYSVLFREISYLCSRFTAVRWAIGELEWSKLTPICSIEWTLSDLLNSAASWVVRHENKYPTPQNPYSDCDYADFSSCEDESGKVSPECLEDMLLECLDELVLLLDNYYVNLEYDEQNLVARALSEFKRTLTYAR